MQYNTIKYIWHVLDSRYHLLPLILICFLPILIHLFIYPGHSVLDTVIDNILDLKFILMISMMFSQMPEFHKKLENEMFFFSKH